MARELSNVTDAKIIAVGDDWQSIFAFSGSDVTLFTKFCEKMGYGKELKITRTYRNAQEVIDIAGGFIQKNDTQIKKSLISPKHIEDPVIVVSYDDTPKKWNERATEGGPLNKMAQALEYSIGEIVAKHGENTSILLIGRYNYDGETLSKTGAFDYNTNGAKVYSKKYPQVDITFLTAHSSKGLGYDNVIIINAKDAIYGFPSKIEDDPVMKLVINQADEMDYAEERRLFYVALTRTKNRVFIIAPQRHPSEFVLELRAEYKNIILKGEFNPEPHGLLTNKVCPICGYPLQHRHRKDCSMNIWACTNEPEICGFVSNNLVGGKMYIQKCTECVDGYLIVKTKDGHPFLGCTNYTHNGRGCNKTIAPYDFDSSVNENEIIELEIIEEQQEIHEESPAKYDFVAPVQEKQSETIAGNEAINEESEETAEIKYFGDELLNSLALSLRAYAEKRAAIENVLYWKVLRRKAVESLCKYLPTRKEELYEKHILLGKEKIEKYGDDIVQIIKQFVETNGDNLDKPQENDYNCESFGANDGGTVKQLLQVDNNTDVIEIIKIIVNACAQISKSNYFGIGMLVNVLRESKNQRIIDYKFNELDCYGVLKSFSANQLSEVIEILVEKDILFKANGLYPTVRVNEGQSIEKISGMDFSSIEKILLPKQTCIVDGWSVHISEDGELLTDMELLKRLQALRKRIAEERYIPYYCIASNNVLVELATKKPITRKEFLLISGIKEKWFDNNGEEFLQEIKGHLQGAEQ